jgi:ATP-dependent Lon protease
LRLSKQIGEQTQESLQGRQREHILREQLRQIQKELGEGEGAGTEIAELREAIEKAKMPEEAEKQALKELARLERTPEASAEHSMIRSYLDWLIELPWSKLSEERIDIAEARRILDEDHYGLPKIKQRILEFLAVRKLNPEGKSPILCFVGPPGVGKTSLGQSIARAIGRKFVRLSLGGLHDEAEIRGHRRTYIGALPGNVIQAIRKAETRNPVMMLDEMDKLGQGFHGDPSAALLEVLDPEQNSTFRDNYLAVPFDLSRVMFVGTANVIDTIPGPLRDRMEIIELPGYTEEEKVEIAKRYLLKRQLEATGLTPGACEITDDAIRAIIQDYTREAGVRNLEREVSNLIRKAVKELTLSPDKKSILVDAKGVSDFLGVPKYRYGELEDEDQIGVVTGLAWTDVGGELLTIESAMMPGKGKMTVTGNLRDVMKESISAAASYVRMRAIAFGIEPPSFDKKDIHVHVPEGATPKDRPSAGVAMVTAIVSVMTGIPVRREVAMTGEITLRGRVLPIGGLKEKLLAAQRGGIKTVLIPEENAKDLVEISGSIKKGLEIVPVSRMDEVLPLALVRKPETIEWDEDKTKAAVAAEPVVEDDASGLTAH